jgi:hypothetical protein
MIAITTQKSQTLMLSRIPRVKLFVRTRNQRDETKKQPNDNILSLVRNCDGTSSKFLRTPYAF